MFRPSRLPFLFSAAVLGSVLGVPEKADAVDDDHTEVGIAPPEIVIRPDQALILSEPFPGGVLVKTPDRLTLFMRRFDFDLLPSSLEVFVDGVEVTESLRFWAERAWMETPPGYWTPGTHVVAASIQDASGGTHSESFSFQNIQPSPATFPVPVSPSEVTNIFENYQSFNNGLKWHRGLDFRCDDETPVYASRSGTVVKIHHYGSGDRYWSLAIQDNDGFVWQYHHIDPDTYTVLENDVVAQGQHLGDVIDWNLPFNNFLYHHLHVNVVRWLGGGAVPGPYVDGWEYHNPLAFFDFPANADTVQGDVFEVFFVPNEMDSAIARDGNPGVPVVMGDIDIMAQTRDLRTEVAGINGHPFNNGWYSLAYSVVPLGECFVGWIPRTTLHTFDKIPYGTSVAGHDSTLLEVYIPFLKWLNSDNYESRFDYDVRKFLYVVTNSLWGVIDADGGYWNTDGITGLGPTFPDGDYEVKIYAEDFAGNEVVYTAQTPVEVSNGIGWGGNCPSWINSINGNGGGDGNIWLEFFGGESIPAPMGSIPVSWGAVIEGSAHATIAAPEWPGWSFTSSARGATYEVRLRTGEKIEAEYVPYLGDVILEIPAEVECIPLVGSAAAPVVASVDLRLSTRLARNEWTGTAHVGSPHPYSGLDLNLVMADPFLLGTENVMLRTDTDGASSTLGLDLTASPPETPVPVRGSLQVYPNPFRARARIRFHAPNAGAVHVEILDVSGRRVRSMHRGYLDAGTVTWTWDGTDDRGVSLPAGVYFVKAEGAEVLGPKKMVRLP